MKHSQATVEMLARTDIQWAWDVITPIDLARFFPKFGLIPATVAVREQTGPWNVVGQSRKVHTADGGYVIEHITDVSEPQFFAYELTDFQKLFKRMIDHARGEWTFTEQEDGTLVSWTYSFYPRPRWGWAVRFIVRRYWGPYMHRILPEIVHEAERLA